MVEICIVVIHMGTECVAYQNIVHSTIRHAECELLVMSDENSDKHCNRCTSYRSTLRALLSRHVKLDADTSHTDPTSYALFSRLSSPDKCIHYHQEHKLQAACQCQVTHLQMKLQAVTEERGIPVDRSLLDDLLQSVKPATFGRVFWETQMQTAFLNDANEMIRESDIIKLPSQ